MLKALKDINYCKCECDKVPQGMFLLACSDEDVMHILLRYDTLIWYLRLEGQCSSVCYLIFVLS